MRKILCGNFEKSFLKSEKMTSRNIFRHFFHTIFFMFVLLISISNRSIWSWLALVSFSKGWNCTRRSGSCGLSKWKMLKCGFYMYLSKFEARIILAGVMNQICQHIHIFNDKEDASEFFSFLLPLLKSQRQTDTPTPQRTSPALCRFLKSDFRT